METMTPRNTLFTLFINLLVALALTGCGAQDLPTDVVRFQATESMSCRVKLTGDSNKGWSDWKTSAGMESSHTVRFDLELQKYDYECKNSSGTLVSGKDFLVRVLATAGEDANTVTIDFTKGTSTTGPATGTGTLEITFDQDCSYSLTHSSGNIKAKSGNGKSGTKIDLGKVTSGNWKLTATTSTTGYKSINKDIVVVKDVDNSYDLTFEKITTPGTPGTTAKGKIKVVVLIDSTSDCAGATQAKVELESYYDDGAAYKSGSFTVPVGSSNSVIKEVPGGLEYYGEATVTSGSNTCKVLWSNDAVLVQSAAVHTATFYFSK